eukprot:36896-Rhodomonas_salina.3
MPCMGLHMLYQSRTSHSTRVRRSRSSPPADPVYPASHAHTYPSPSPASSKVAAHTGSAGSPAHVAWAGHGAQKLVASA